MSVEPESLEALIAEFAGLPGIGQKTARRLAYHVLTRPKSDIERFAGNLTNAIEKVHPCPKCHAFTDEEQCPICSERDHKPRRSEQGLAPERQEASAFFKCV